MNPTCSLNWELFGAEMTLSECVSAALGRRGLLVLPSGSSLVGEAEAMGFMVVSWQMYLVHGMHGMQIFVPSQEKDEVAKVSSQWCSDSSLRGSSLTTLTPFPRARAAHGLFQRRDCGHGKKSGDDRVETKEKSGGATSDSTQLNCVMGCCWCYTFTRVKKNRKKKNCKKTCEGLWNTRLPLAQELQAVCFWKLGRYSGEFSLRPPCVYTLSWERVLLGDELLVWAAMTFLMR